MGNLTSLIFYIFFFLLSILFYNLYNKHNKRLFLILSFMIPMIIGGYRYNVGTDYLTYKLMYENNVYPDFGFKIISQISNYLNGFESLIFIYNFLTLLFMYKGIGKINRNSRTLAYSMFLFLYYTVSFNAVRQMLAVSIIYFSYYYLIENKTLKFLFHALLASIFHTTSILVILLCFILKVNNKFIKYTILIVMTFFIFNFENVILFLSNYTIFNHYSLYAVEYSGISFNNFTFFFDMMILMYIMMYKRKIFEYDAKNEKFLFIYMISIILSLSGFVNPFVKRIALFFKIVVINLLSSIPAVCGNAAEKKYNKIIITFIIVGHFILSAYILKQANIIPYKFLN